MSGGLKLLGPFLLLLQPWRRLHGGLAPVTLKLLKALRRQGAHDRAGVLEWQKPSRVPLLFATVVRLGSRLFSCMCIGSAPQMLALKISRLRSRNASIRMLLLVLLILLASGCAACFLLTVLMPHSQLNIL